MYKFISVFLIMAGSLVFFTNCSKKAETATDTTNIATAVVANLATISSGYTPSSLDSVNSTSVTAQSDPCAGVTDFAVCQSNLIREYLQIGRTTVDAISSIGGAIGQSLGEVPDGNAGTSTDGAISWNKTSTDVWSILKRGTGGATQAYFSINNGVYTLKIDQSKDEVAPVDQQIEATVTYTDADNWDVDVYFANSVCDPTDVGRPSKARIKLTKTAGLWSGKSMLYVPRWKAPGVTPTCATTAGTLDITMYTDFVGNDTSTKAALYLVPSSVGVAPSSTYSLLNFCSNFSGYCGGAGQPTAGALSTYTNNWCTTGAGTTPTWGNNCSSNAAVSAASYSSSSYWTVPSALKVKTVTMPTSL